MDHDPSYPPRTEAGDMVALARLIAEELQTVICKWEDTGIMETDDEYLKVVRERFKLLEELVIQDMKARLLQ